MITADEGIYVLFATRESFNNFLILSFCWRRKACSNNVGVMRYFKTI